MARNRHCDTRSQSRPRVIYFYYVFSFSHRSSYIYIDILSAPSKKITRCENAAASYENGNCSKLELIYCRYFLFVLHFHNFDAAHCGKRHRNRGWPIYCCSDNRLLGQKVQQFVSVGNRGSGACSMFLLPRNGKYLSAVLLGFRSGCRCRISAVGVLYSSRWATEQGNSVLTIAAVRFHLAWIISGLVAFFSVEAERLKGSTLPIVLLSVMCITFPILLLQWGITLTLPLTSALIIATLPTVVMATEIALGSQVEPIQLTLLLLIVAITISQAILGTRRTSENISD